MTGPSVTICTVTFNAAEELPAYLEAVAALDHRPLDLVLVDCASVDDTVARAESFVESSSGQALTLKIIALTENVGFAGGMNVALGNTAAPFVLSLNADTRPRPDFVDRLLAVFDPSDRDRLGAVTGRLGRFASGGGPPTLDACGMRLTPTWRHLDRGSGERDRGQFDRPVRVFGGTGAATLFRRCALDDVALDGQVFDPDFHSFREDAELCFRLRERRWEIVYEPTARALHRRFNLPERRSTMPAAVNCHSLKNRYLLRIYHQSFTNLAVTMLPTLARDLGILAWVLVREQSSLEAYRWLWRNRRRLLERRRLIRSRRLAPAWQIDRWFLRSELPI